MELVPSVHLVPDMRGANVYLLLGEALSLVDAGMPGTEETILNYIDSLGRDASELTRIILTHHHLDHVGSAAALKARTSAQVVAHRGDALCISGERPPPPPRGAIQQVLLGLLAPLMPKAQPVAVDTTVQDGEHQIGLGTCRHE